MNAPEPALVAGAVDETLSLRVADALDRPILYRWHVEAYRAYIEQLWSWDEDWQRRDFGKLFAALPPLVVMRHGMGVGYIQTQARDGALHLANIVLRPNARGQGVGAVLIRYLQSTAERQGRAVTLKVFRSNPRARAFYERHGFEATGETRMHIEMRWPAGGQCRQR